MSQKCEKTENQKIKIVFFSKCPQKELSQNYPFCVFGGPKHAFATNNAHGIFKTFLPGIIGGKSEKLYVTFEPFGHKDSPLSGRYLVFSLFLDNINNKFPKV